MLIKWKSKKKKKFLQFVMNCDKNEKKYFLYKQRTKKCTLYINKIKYKLNHKILMFRCF